MNRLLIIGKRKADPLSPIIQDGVGLGYTHVAHCSTRLEFIEAVRHAATVSPLELVDIFDHGAPGAMAIGDELLLNIGASPPNVEAFESLHHYLAPTAQVRLLGCNTAVGSPGRKLLVKLAAELGEQRIVFGTIDRVEPYHFGPDGFTLVEELLFSSVAALDSEAPSIGARINAILDFKVPVVRG